MKPGHTPGPWTAREAEDGYYADMNIVRADGLAVAAAVMNGNITRMETAHNGFLIAAAPDLLAALEDAIALYGKPGGPWNVPSDPGGWLDRARNAVEKAKPW